jgi:hypothetical protein
MGSTALAIILLLCVVDPVDSAFAIETVQTKVDSLGVVRIAETGIEGAKMSVDAESSKTSRFLYIGCHQAPTTIVADYAVPNELQAVNSYDPNDCVTKCVAEFPDAPPGGVVAAVSKDRCGCALKPRFVEVFVEVDARNCDEPCPNYGNLLCGGLPDYFGVFMDYDKLALSGQGAYDPWRYIFYQVVTIEWGTTGDLLPGVPRNPYGVPERYYLHAMSTSSGAALFEFQVPNCGISTPEPCLGGLLYGLQYDLDSSRIVGVYIEKTTGRFVTNTDWEYTLMTIDVNTTDFFFGVALPKVKRTMQTNTMFRPAAAFQAQDVFASLSHPLAYLSFTGGTGIISLNGLDSYVFTQADGGDTAATADNKRTMTDRIFIASIPDGEVIYDEALDFKVLQILANEKFGHVSALGPRDQPGAAGPVQQYIYLGRVFYSEGEMKKKMDWQFNRLAPILLTESGVLDDVWFYPAMSCSEHMFNKSLISYKSLPPANSGESFSGIPGSVIQVDLTEPSATLLWGDNGTVPADVAWFPLFNREPRIPLTLAAPALIEARFDMEAGSIIVKFDQPTLKGAALVDADGDFVPDLVDYTSQMTEAVSCDRIFNEATVAKLGTCQLDNCCEWPTNEMVVISLPTDFTMTVGDSIYVKEDTIWTVPRNGEYSMASSGGVTVEMPKLEITTEVDGEVETVLLAPAITVTGPTEVDQCSPALINAKDTYQTGGAPVFTWTLLNYTDVGNRPDRVYNETIMQALLAKLDNVTQENLPYLDIGRNALEQNTVYNFQLTVGSRWGLESTKLIRITKLDSPSPMVHILGKAVQTTNRTSTTSLVASAKASECASVGTKLGFRWYETSGKLNFEEYPNIRTGSKTLVIPPFIVVPEVQYEFAVDCFVVTEPDKVATADVTLRVQRSPVFVVLGSLRAARESRMMSKGDILVLDARESQDPDYPTPEGQTFKGTYRWFCVNANQEPCFAGNTPELLDVQEQICRVQREQSFVDGGNSFSVPIFDAVPYCRYARGVLMVNKCRRIPRRDLSLVC